MVIPTNYRASLTVPEVGLEPTRPCGHTILSRACMPFHHSGYVDTLYAHGLVFSTQDTTTADRRLTSSFLYATLHAWHRSTKPLSSSSIVTCAWTTTRASYRRSHRVSASSQGLSSHPNRRRTMPIKATTLFNSCPSLCAILMLSCANSVADSTSFLAPQNQSSPPS